MQAEGTVDGVPFYFRSRGNRWSLRIGVAPLSNSAWCYEESFSNVKFAAGWITEDLAREFIQKAVGIYRVGIPPAIGVCEVK